MSEAQPAPSSADFPSFLFTQRQTAALVIALVRRLGGHVEISPHEFYEAADFSLWSTTSQADLAQRLWVQKR